MFRPISELEANKYDVIYAHWQFFSSSTFIFKIFIQYSSKIGMYNNIRIHYMYSDWCIDMPLHPVRKNKPSRNFIQSKSNQSSK